VDKEGSTPVIDMKEDGVGDDEVELYGDGILGVGDDRSRSTLSKALLRGADREEVTGVWSLV
jgi:hypothetical protein